MRPHTEKASLGKKLVHGAVVATGALALTLTFFLVLPLIQAIGNRSGPDTELRAMDTAQLPPPPVHEEPEPEPEEEPEEEPPPELADEPLRLDLAQLELALNPAAFGDGWLDGDFAAKLNPFDAAANAEAFLADGGSEQKARVIYQANPVITPKMRRKAPGSVVVIYIVDKQGKVKNPIVESSTDSVFNKAALDAIKKWEFEPRKVGGEPAESHQRVTITFPR